MGCCSADGERRRDDITRAISALATARRNSKHGDRGGPPGELRHKTGREGSPFDYGTLSRAEVMFICTDFVTLFQYEAHIHRPNLRG